MPKYLPPLQSECLFTLLQRVAETYPICDDPLSGSAPHRNIMSRYVKRSPIQYGFMSAQELHVLRYPGGGTLGISGWGCAAGTLGPLTYTRATVFIRLTALGAY